MNNDYVIMYRRFASPNMRRVTADISLIPMLIRELLAADYEIVEVLKLT